MLTRRSFVQTVGIGGAAAYIGARGRENSTWQAFKPTLEAAADPGVTRLSSNETRTAPVRPVALDANFKIDLDKFAAAAKGSGLVFYCNPNNPTATYVGARATRDFLAQVAKQSPYTYVLIDEAYFDYVTDPDHETHIPI